MRKGGNYTEVQKVKEYQSRSITTHTSFTIAHRGDIVMKTVIASDRFIIGFTLLHLMFSARDGFDGILQDIQRFVDILVGMGITKEPGLARVVIRHDAAFDHPIH